MRFAAAACLLLVFSSIAVAQNPAPPKPIESKPEVGKVITLPRPPVEDAPLAPKPILAPKPPVESEPSQSKLGLDGIDRFQFSQSPEMMLKLLDFCDYLSDLERADAYIRNDQDMKRELTLQVWKLRAQSMTATLVEKRRPTTYLRLTFKDGVWQPEVVDLPK